jgi:hypothetical protein
VLIVLGSFIWVWSTGSFIHFSSTEASLTCSGYIISNTINNPGAPEREEVRVASSFSSFRKQVAKGRYYSKIISRVDVLNKVGSKNYLYTKGWSLNSDDRLHDFCPIAAGQNEQR